MQILLSFSEEIKTDGLNIINGHVKEFPKNLGLKLPHVGWNKINKTSNNFY